MVLSFPQGNLHILTLLKLFVEVLPPNSHWIDCNVILRAYDIITQVFLGHKVTLYVIKLILHMSLTCHVSS